MKVLLVIFEKTWNGETVCQFKRFVPVEYSKAATIDASWQSCVIQEMSPSWSRFVQEGWRTKHVDFAWAVGAGEDGQRWVHRDDATDGLNFVVEHVTQYPAVVGFVELHLDRETFVTSQHNEANE